MYDEGFGISGRLVAHCSVKGGSTLCQFFNREELDILSDSLWECGYYRNPGSDTKAFDMTLFVFEMLYGSELVDAVLERYEREKERREQEELDKKREEALGPGGVKPEPKVKRVEGWAVGDHFMERVAESDFINTHMVTAIECDDSGEKIKYITYVDDKGDEMILSRDDLGSIIRLDDVEKKKEENVMVKDLPMKDDMDLDDDDGKDDWEIIAAPEGDVGKEMKVIPDAGNVSAEASVMVVEDEGVEGAQ